MLSYIFRVNTQRSNPVLVSTFVSVASKENHKSGFVNIIGKPNVGKSTLMNALIGEKLSIITSKAQTTRHRIFGIVNGENFQLIIGDSPGIIEPAYKLQRSMMKFVNASFEDADIILFMTEVKLGMKIDKHIEKKLRAIDVPVYIAVNKIDQVEDSVTAEVVNGWKEKEYAVDVFPVSAKGGHGIEKLLKVLIGRLPEHPAYFPKDQITDKSERFFVEEIVREKILTNYKQEIPYSVELVVDSFKEEENIIRISVIIYTSRKSQKPILIGKNGSMLKKVGTEARKDLEIFFGKKVFLETFVKIKENWRDDERSLRHFGYE